MTPMLATRAMDVRYCQPEPCVGQWLGQTSQTRNAHSRHSAARTSRLEPMRLRSRFISETYWTW